MKVLQVSNKIPYPEKDGGAIAINAITEGLLRAGCELKMLAMNTRKHFIDVSSIPEKFRINRQLETVVVDASVKPLAALIALLIGKSYNISRFQSKGFNTKLISILKQETFDVIHLEGLYLAPYLSVIKQYSKAPVILRTHNIEWKIWQKLALEENNLLKKWYLNQLARQLKKYEEEVVNLFDGIATITHQDLEYLKSIGCKAPLITISFGLNISKYTVQESKYPNSLFYIGALDWLPNLQGIDWFLNNVWQQIHSRVPDVQFHVAGRNMPESLRNSKYSGVVFHGEVDDAKSFMQEYDIMPVPLLAGSGVRIKIIEGMAMGKSIITTNTGIEGIECNLGEDVLVADSPEQFAQAVCKCITNKDLKQMLGQNARKYAEENNNIEKSAALLINFYRNHKNTSR